MLLKLSKKLITLEDMLNKYVNKGYVFRLTNEPNNLVPNINYKFKHTPYGLYFYPLDSFHLQKLLKRDLYASYDRKYIVIFKIKSSNILKISEYTQENLIDDLEKISEIVGYKIRYINDGAFKESPFTVLMNKLRHVTKSSKQIALFLNKIGYNVIYDDGTSSFTNDIKSQIWVISSSFVEPIETIKNSLINTDKNDFINSEEDKDIYNKLMQANSPSTSLEDLQILMKDTDADIKNRAIINYLNRKDRRLLLNIKSKDILQTMAEIAVSKTNQQMLSDVIDNPWTGDGTYYYLYDLAKEHSVKIIFELLSNSDRTPVSILKELKDNGYKLYYFAEEKLKEHGLWNEESQKVAAAKVQ
jgi:hypothetical protein